MYLKIISMCIEMCLLLFKYLIKNIRYVKGIIILIIIIYKYITIYSILGLSSFRNGISALIKAVHKSLLKFHFARSARSDELLGIFLVFCFLFLVIDHRR